MCGSILINVRSATDRIGVRLRIRCVQRHTCVCMGSQTQVTHLRLFLCAHALVLLFSQRHSFLVRVWSVDPFGLSHPSQVSLVCHTD